MYYPGKEREPRTASAEKCTRCQQPEYIKKGRFDIQPWSLSLRDDSLVHRGLSAKERMD